MPAKVPFRPQRTTKKPTVRGPQTAMVAGKAGEEIWTDKYGRVKVKFPWDPTDTVDETASCWIRVSQNWAGKNWGSFLLPRIGQEVIVDFLEGDPDRPIITGRVYNADHMPPYALPSQQTMSTIKSNSSKGSQGFNELRFEDKKGSEQIFIHGQRQLDIRVNANVYETNGGNKEEVIGSEKDGVKSGDHNVHIKHNNNYHLEGDQFILIDKGQQSHITEDVLNDFGKNLTVIVKNGYEIQAQTLMLATSDSIQCKSASIKQQGTQEVHLKGDKTYMEGSSELHLKGGGPINLGAAKDVNVKGDNVNIQGQTSISLKAPTINLEGDTAVNIKVGGNFVAISSASVAINGTTVLINSGGAAGPATAAEDAKGAADVTSPGSHDVKSPVDAAPADNAQAGTVGTTTAPRGLTGLFASRR